MFSYQVYGIHVMSELKLPCPKLASSHQKSKNLGHSVTLTRANSKKFEKLRTQIQGTPQWFHRLILENGSQYLRWRGLFEFLVSSDGRFIECLKLQSASHESFGTYLLGQVLSFSLLASQIEPLHGTGVCIEGQALLLLGDCGYGKSTLGAALLQQGYPLITDDLAVFRIHQKHPSNEYLLQVGMPRLKLFWNSLKMTLPHRKSTPMVLGTQKQLIALQAHERVTQETSLQAIYLLCPPEQHLKKSRARVLIRKLPARPAFFGLIKNTFNSMVLDTQRIQNQFQFCENLVRSVPILHLSYPRQWQALENVCDQLVSDFKKRLTLKDE